VALKPRFRKASGIEGVKLYTDVNFSQDLKSQAFDVLLDLESPNAFINHLQAQKIITTEQARSLSSRDAQIHLNYQPEKRFADGPFPFALSMKSDSQETAQGNFLIYPNNLDVRGSTQGQRSAISFLKTLLSIQDQEDADQNLRLEGNLKDLL